MTMQTIDTTAVAVHEGASQPPATLFRTDDPVGVVEQASRVANALAGVIRAQKLSRRFGGADSKEHVYVEGWTLLGSMLGVFPVVEWSRPLQDGNGWEARVVARTKGGDTVGTAEAMCSRDEQTWHTRPDYALRSMAITRATSKAMRMPLGFVMTLAGFEATPADEMTVESEAARTPPPAPALGKCPDGHPISDGKFGPQCKGKNADGSWHNWRPPKQPQPAPDDAIPADFREVDEAPEERGSGDDALKAAAAKLKDRAKPAPDPEPDDMTPMSALWTRVQQWAAQHGTDPQRLCLYMATARGVPAKVGAEAMRTWLGSQPGNTLDRLYDLYVAGESGQQPATDDAEQGAMPL